MTNERSPLSADKSLRQLWYIHGKYYDLDPFLSQHPGSDVIKLGRGHDCTAFWVCVDGRIEHITSGRAMLFHTQEELVSFLGKNLQGPAETMPNDSFDQDN